ncbi:MAG: hypothetical protein KQI35_11920 [Bacteroidetes bacterium]|nr:hypothetical protein [Bacteroidota bacterium]
MRKFFNSILFISVLVLLAACFPEYKLARSFIKAEKDISILVLPTNYVFKENLKRSEAGDTSGMTGAQVDSLLMAKSILLKDISDSIFLETFINSMMIEFEKLGFKVYNQSYADSILFIKSPAYILNIGQILIEEHYNKYKDQEEIGDYEYFKTIDQNALTFNFWFELGELNDEQQDPKLFFASETINDLVTGYFLENPFTGNVKYKYNVSEIDLDLVYKYCAILGERYAGYTYDYLMNKYIQENWDLYREPYFYMHYKRYNKSLDSTEEERFIEME